MRVAQVAVMNCGVVVKPRWIAKADGSPVTPSHFMHCGQTVGLAVITVSTRWVGVGFLATICNGRIRLIPMFRRKTSPPRISGAGRRNTPRGIFKKVMIILWPCLMGLFVVTAGQDADCLLS